MQTKPRTETNVSSDYVGVLNLETIIPSSAFIFSTNSVISFSQIHVMIKMIQFMNMFYYAKSKMKELVCPSFTFALLYTLSLP